MSEHGQQQVPPGWYEPSAKPGLLAYWNGHEWDHSVPPQPAPRPGSGYVSSGLQTMGWLCAFFFPIAGFVIGCMCIAKGPEKEGWSMTIVSGVVAVIGFFILVNSQGPTYY